MHLKFHSLVTNFVLLRFGVTGIALKERFNMLQNSERKLKNK